MSKSAGGGGLKGHDKGSSGKCKVVKKEASLEAALEKVEDVTVCPAGHKMKLHTGSRKEGELTCDGPDDVCCGRFGDGILYVGDKRYSCVQCDFDICPECVELEVGEDLTPEQQKEAARQRLREKLGNSRRQRGTAAAQARAEEKQGTKVGAATADIAEDDEAKAKAAKRAEIEKAVAEAKAKASAAEDEAKAEAKRQAARAKKAAQKARRQAAKAADAPEPEQPEEAAPADEADEADEAEEAPASPAPSTPEPANPVAAAFAAAAAAAAAPKPKRHLSKAANPLVCPFTNEIFQDPVVTADGHTYERKAIAKYLEANDVSPLTGEKLAHKSLTPNLMALDLCRRALDL